MKRASDHRTKSLSSRAGATMVIALIALLLASLMIAGLLKTASMSHRQLKRDEFRIQASLLADAGCARALTLMRDEPDFTQAVWEVPAEQMTSGRRAIVRMRILMESGPSKKRTVSVTAEYPLGHPDQVRLTRNIEIP